MAAIKNFESCFEIGYRLIKRHLESTATSAADIDQLDFRDVIRRAVEHGLVSDERTWLAYRHNRNGTFHTYSEHRANEIHATLPAFAVEMVHLSKVPDQAHAS